MICGICKIQVTGPHNPYLYKIGGDPSEKGWWTVWKDGTRLDIPVQEGLIRRTRPNAGHLQDWRAYDGYFYLIYAVIPKMRAFGHGAIISWGWQEVRI